MSTVPMAEPVTHRRSPERAAAVIDRASRMRAAKPSLLDRRLFDRQMRTPGAGKAPINFDYLKHRDSVRARRLTVFTGPIDEFFGFDLGRLHYRGQRRVHEYLPEVDRAQPCGQVNNPTHAGGPHIRTLEWKHMMSRDAQAGIKGTLLTREFPSSPTKPGEYEYPFVQQMAAGNQYSKREVADAGS